MAATAGGTCYCGNSIAGGYTFVTSAQCTTPCPGNAQSQCGGPNNRLSVFNSTVENVASNSTSPSKGCFTDPNTLDVGAYYGGYMTVSQCVYYCKGLGTTYAGLVNGNQCRCGNTSPFSATSRSVCNVPCVSNATENCGGNNNVDVWETSKASLFTDPYKAVAGGMGCWTEASGSILTNMTSFTSSTLTPVSCSANCYAKGMMFSAARANMCYCGSSIAYGVGLTRQADSQCNSACAGDSSLTCGGSQRVNIRAAVPGSSTSAGASGTASASAVPSSAAIEGYKGCYAPGTIVSGATVKYTNDNMNIGLCRRFCRANGLPAAALSSANGMFSLPVAAYTNI